MKKLVFELLIPTMLSRALYTAAELDIAEHLESGVCTVLELAKVTKTDARTLARLLYFLSLNKIFDCDDDGRFGLNTMSRQLLGSHPETVKPLLLHDDETRWNCYGNLTTAIREGKPSFDGLYGKNYFEYLKGCPLLSKRFDEAMNIISGEEDAVIAKKIQVQGVLVDIGGGNGQLVKQFFKAQPNISSAILFDLPTVVAHASFDNPRIRTQGGSFFDPFAIVADTFVLKRIIHDWDDEQALMILKNVSNTMKKDSVLWVIDGSLGAMENNSVLAAIDLALLCIFGGKERSLQDFTGLIEKAGLKIKEVKPLTALVAGIACIKT